MVDLKINGTHIQSFNQQDLKTNKYIIRQFFVTQLNVLCVARLGRYSRTSYEKL